MSSALIREIVEAPLLRSDIQHPSPGDTVEVDFKVIEGKKERVQRFEGIVIGLYCVGIMRKVRVRKISFGVGVEKLFPLHSPRLMGIKILKQGKVRRAKLYYMRARKGKGATRIKSK